MRKFLTSIFEKLADKLREKEIRSSIIKNEEVRKEIQPKAKKRPQKRKPIEKKSADLSYEIKDSPLPISRQKMKIISVAEDIRLDPDRAESAFMARQLVQATLPHKNPGDIQAWSRTNGNLSLTIRPGWDAKKNKSIGYPYGTIPRLLLFWITTEAIRTKSRRLELGDSLSGFLGKVGLSYSTGGGKRGDIKRLQNQMERLLRANISLDVFKKEGEEDGKRWVDMQVAPEGELWWNFKNPGQSSIFNSWIELSEKFYEALTFAPVPVDVRALKALKRSPLALDFYAWSTYTTYQAQKNGKERSISWEWLHKQFGAEYGKTEEFARNAWKALLKVKAVYPELHIERVKGGISVLPSKPAIQAAKKR
jgi:hypothetical protein